MASQPRVFKVAGVPYPAAKSEFEAGEMARERAYRARTPKWRYNVSGTTAVIQPSGLLKYATGTTQPGLEKQLPRWQDISLDNRKRLENAVHVAPMMVREALKALRGHLAKKNSKITDASDTDLDFTEVGLGLLKYFNIERATYVFLDKAKTDERDYWHLIEGIIKVYETIQRALSNEYKIDLGGSLNANWRGRVGGMDMGKVDAGASPIRLNFGFPDEWGHKEFKGFSEYFDIELNYEGYVCAPGVQYDQIARTIVHEASHRWASTKDVLYKHQSFHKDDQFKKTPLPASDLKIRAQNTIIVPGRNKPFIPMLGREKSETNLVPPERWLENADSYAWFARRMWKRAGRPSA